MCNFGILLTRTSEEGLPLFKEELAEYFHLLSFGGYHLQQREGFFASWYSVLKTSLGIYGLNIRPVGNYRQGQMYTSHTSRSLAKIDLDHRGKRLSKLKNKITVHILHYSYKILCDIAQLHENKCLYHTYKTTVISQTYLFHETTSL